MRILDKLLTWFHNLFASSSLVSLRWSRVTSSVLGLNFRFRELRCPPNRLPQQIVPNRSSVKKHFSMTTWPRFQKKLNAGEILRVIFYLLQFYLNSDLLYLLIHFQSVNKIHMIFSEIFCKLKLTCYCLLHKLNKFLECVTWS